MMDIRILFEDENILALDKPAGIAVHPDGKRERECVTDFLLQKYPEIKDVGEPMELEGGIVIPRPGIVHRIDKDTSGVLLVAKTQVGYEHLKHQFKERIIKKTYHAFVYRDLQTERGIIDKAIGRSAGSISRFDVSNIRGAKREAITRYKVLKHTKVASFLEVWPLTGRTHQIRVHLKAVHHPIVCDSLYAPKQPTELGFKRLALHASSITFRDLEGKEREIKSVLPADFEEAKRQIGL
jgi:23S rRNA pseudouridine1911/1915/1917 synthase